MHQQSGHLSTPLALPRSKQQGHIPILGQSRPRASAAIPRLLASADKPISIPRTTPNAQSFKSGSSTPERSDPRNPFRTGSDRPQPSKLNLRSRLGDNRNQRESLRETEQLPVGVEGATGSATPRDRAKEPPLNLPRGERGRPLSSRHSSSDLLSRIDGGSGLTSASNPPSPSSPEDHFAEYPSDSDVTMHSAERTTPNTVALQNLMEKARLRALARTQSEQGQQEKESKVVRPSRPRSGSNGPPRPLAERLGLLQEPGTMGEMEVDPPLATEPSVGGETFPDKATELLKRFEERPNVNQQAIQPAQSSSSSSCLAHNSTPTVSPRIHIAAQRRSISTSPTRQEPTDDSIATTDNGDVQNVPPAQLQPNENRSDPVVTAVAHASAENTENIEDATLDADENQVDASLFVVAEASVDRDVPPHLDPPVVTSDSSAERMRVLRERLLMKKQEKKVELPEARPVASSSRHRLDDDQTPISLPTGVHIGEFGTRQGQTATGSGQEQQNASSKGESTSGSSSKRSSKPSKQGSAPPDDQESGRGDRDDRGPRRPSRHTNFPDVDSDRRRFQPIGESIYVPHNLKHPFRLYPNGTRFDIQEASRHRLETHTVPDSEYLAVASMPACDYTSRMLEFQESPRDQRKLLTLDLNGCLVVRSKHGSSGGTPRRV